MQLKKASGHTWKMLAIPAMVIALALAAAGCGRDEEVIFSVQEAEPEENESSGEHSRAAEEKTFSGEESPENEGNSGGGSRDEDPGAKTAEIPAGAICVYVTGAVRSPGVYRLGDGARVTDAVDSAGGFTKDAAAEWVNLAAKAEDGMQIHIPTYAEVEAAGSTMQWGVSSGTGTESPEKNKVNINTADVQTLMTLSGIGKAKAEAIVAYRELHGPFSSVGEIRNVKGIKDSVFETIKESITVN